jgi:hypothetical protein
MRRKIQVPETLTASLILMVLNAVFCQGRDD